MNSKHYKSPDRFVEHILTNWDHYGPASNKRYSRGGFRSKFAFGKYSNNPKEFFTSYKDYDEKNAFLFRRALADCNDFAPLTTSNKSIVVNDVVGYKPIIPNFLNGNPLCMRRNKTSRDRHEPLTIWFSMSVRADAENWDMMMQAALVYRVMQIVKKTRPVKMVMYQGSEPDPKLCIDVSPNISVERFSKVAYTPFRRGARWLWLDNKNGERNTWDWGFPSWSRVSSVNTEEQKQAMRDYMGIDVKDQDIVFPEGIGIANFRDGMHSWLMDAMPEYREQYERENK